MPVDLLNPDGLTKPETHWQVAVASGSRTVYLSGQVARTSASDPVGVDDLAAQVEQAYLNVATAVAAVGGSFDDVAKLTLYVVDWGEEKMSALGEGIERAAARLGVDPVKPTTLVGVAALSEPYLLVEVDVIADPPGPVWITLPTRQPPRPRTDRRTPGVPVRRDGRGQNPADAGFAP